MANVEYKVEGRLLVCRDGKVWQAYSKAQNHHRVAIVWNDGQCVAELHVNATSIEGGPTKVLVDDLASAAFRHRLVEECVQPDDKLS